MSEIGQFGLIDLLAGMVEKTRNECDKSWSCLLHGIGDDCAVWRPESLPVLGKVDCQVQNVHFQLDIIGWADLGWKALAVNLSDIAAMGGAPRYALVSLGLPLTSAVEDVQALYRGLLELASQTGTAVVGGNVSGSGVVFIDVNVIGVTGNPAGRYLTRATARPGDDIAVTGWLGSAAAGLRILKQKLALPQASAGVLKEAFARPHPRLKEGRLLVEKGVFCAMDISDGLVADLGHICRASGVSASLNAEKLPILPEVRQAFGDAALEMALSGGEDYQLLFTGPPSVIADVIRASDYPVNIIGQIKSGPAGQVRVSDQSGRDYTPVQTGWDHFRSK